MRLELGRYSSCIGLFGTFHAMEDRDRFDALTWWEAYGGQELLPKLEKKVLSQVVNTSSAKRLLVDEDFFELECFSFLEDDVT